MQQKTKRPVPCDITDQTRDAVGKWMQTAGLRPEDCLFHGRLNNPTHLSTRQ
jgi:hypothetical protein